MRIFNKKRLLCPALLLALILSGCGQKEEGLRVVFPKLGSADCAILMTEEATVLIDTGEDEDGEEILALLEEYGRDQVDLMLISHYDKDHVGGADQILKSIPVKRVVGSTSPKESEDYDEYQAALADAGLREEVYYDKTLFNLGPLSLIVYPPEELEYAGEQSNNSSLAVIAAYGKINLLFTGDAMEERTSELLSTLELDGNLRFDLIKLPHHGRDTETAWKIVSALAGEDTVGVVTSSKKEPEAADLLEALPITVYLTRHGQVVAESDGKSLTVTQN